MSGVAVSRRLTAWCLAVYRRWCALPAIAGGYRVIDAPDRAWRAAYASRARSGWGMRAWGDRRRVFGALGGLPGWGMRAWSDRNPAGSGAGQ